MLKELKDTLKFYSQLDEGRIIFEILKTDRELQDRILDLNRMDQLFNKGIDSTGKLLSDIGGNYSPFTIEVKKGKGLPFAHVTLFDTGEFYDSFELMVTQTFIDITANPIKDDTNLFTEWGKDILGLTEESKEILLDLLIPKIQAYLDART